MPSCMVTVIDSVSGLPLGGIPVREDGVYAGKTGDTARTKGKFVVDGNGHSIQINVSGDSGYDASHSTSAVTGISGDVSVPLDPI